MAICSYNIVSNSTQNLAFPVFTKKHDTTKSKLLWIQRGAGGRCEVRVNIRINSWFWVWLLFMTMSYILVETWETKVYFSFIIYFVSSHSRVIIIHILLVEIMCDRSICQESLKDNSNDFQQKNMVDFFPSGDLDNFQPFLTSISIIKSFFATCFNFRFNKLWYYTILLLYKEIVQIIIIFYHYVLEIRIIIAVRITFNVFKLWIYLYYINISKTFFLHTFYSILSYLILITIISMLQYLSYTVLSSPLHLHVNETQKMESHLYKM